MFELCITEIKMSTKTEMTSGTFGIGRTATVLYDKSFNLRPLEFFIAKLDISLKTFVFCRDTC